MLCFNLKPVAHAQSSDFAFPAAARVKQVASLKVSITSRACLISSKERLKRGYRWIAKEVLAAKEHKGRKRMKESWKIGFRLIFLVLNLLRSLCSFAANSFVGVVP